MEDTEVIASFIGGSKKAFGPSLHIEGDALLLDGWWPTVYRISADAFIVRAEEPPTDTPVMADVYEALRARGLQHVGTDLPAITQITYTAQFSLGYVPWDLWAPDLPAGEAALASRAMEESFLEAAQARQGAGDFSAEIGGARRVAGLPPSIVLTVGVGPDAVSRLEETLPDCRLVAKALGEITPDACGALIPTVMVVDATGPAGREFMMELRAAACGRTIPVLAVTAEPGVPLGANAAVSTADDPTAWVKPIRDLLP
jgi:hypothetical protein